MEPLLSLSHLVKHYATQKAVDDISFDIQKGSIFGLPNKGIPSGCMGWLKALYRIGFHKIFLNCRKLGKYFEIKLTFGS